MMTGNHHTFFEMLGNFSFGDYFKREAIERAWDFLVNELKLDTERLWFTVFGGDGEVPADEEAATLWIEMGAKPERVLRFDRKDNFWQMAETGPCGPNSEINYYLGEHPNDPAFNRAEFVNGPGDTTMEIWNLVFMQYNRVEAEPGKYKLEPLPAPSVDTGAGLERLAVVMQGVKSNYDTDLIKDIVEFTAKLADRHYEPDTQEGFAMRVIADHARATAFSIADGILPSNEGRNYVLRKIMRRAIYQGRHALGLDGLFFNEVTNFVVDQMKEAFPELEAQRGFIEKMVRLEEERFGNTLTVGLKKLDEIINVSRNQETGEVEIPILELAKLYDTFGTPIDLMHVILSQGKHRLTYKPKNVVYDSRTDFREHSLLGWEDDEYYKHDPKYFRYKIENIDEEKFRKGVDYLLKELQQNNPEAQKAERKKTKPVYVALSRRNDTKSEFKGYEATSVDTSKIIALIKGDDEVQSLREGDEGEAVLNHTPFYAESGGQVGDVGAFVNEHVQAVVADTYSPAQGLIVHKVKVEKGSLKVGETVSARVDVEKRDATRRNHTATHLMHAALREVLGTHVKQAGSIVAPNYLRFDFSHYQPLTRDEIAEVERLVNYHILRNEQVQTDIIPLEEAMRSGAMALFGEKYGEQVRVLSVPGAEGVFSKELCGGTHVRATGDIGLFKIVSDESIASGTRRIRAVTGVDAFQRFQETEALVDQLSSELRTTRGDISTTVGRIQEELKKARRDADELRIKIAMGAGAQQTGNGSKDARQVSGGVTVLAREASDLDASALRQLSDTLLDQIKSGVVVLGRRADGKASIIVRTSHDLKQRIPAGQVIKELAPIIGGRGGGKPDMAEGGGSEPQKLAEALEASYQIVERLLEGSRAPS
ncbi:MAG: alanine--tRNA ligase [Acidobacteria bacterium]|nr:alanine--tRNA ligase [Acidobacteriota bacterium]